MWNNHNFLALRNAESCADSAGVWEEESTGIMEEA